MIAIGRNTGAIMTPSSHATDSQLHQPSCLGLSGCNQGKSVPTYNTAALPTEEYSKYALLQRWWTQQLFASHDVQGTPGHSRVAAKALRDRRGGSQLAEGDWCRQAGAQGRTMWAAAGQC